MKLVFDRISALDAYAEWGRAGRDSETYCAVLAILTNCRFATSGNERDAAPDFATLIQAMLVDETSGTFLLSQKCLERFNRRCGFSKQTPGS